VQFDAMTRAGPDARNVKIGGKWGRIALDGRWLLEPRFDYLSNEPGIFVAAIDGLRGFMRSDGTWLIEPTFGAVLRDADTAFVTVSGGTGVMRLKGSDLGSCAAYWRHVRYPLRNHVPSRRQTDHSVPGGGDWIDLEADRISIGLELGLLTFLRHGK
jgi:hypothetical protein